MNSLGNTRLVSAGAVASAIMLWIVAVIVLLAAAFPTTSSGFSS